MIECVLFDLDDTLYPQFQWLDGAWARVCDAASPWGVEDEPLRRALEHVAADGGSAGGGIIDRALALVGAADVPVAPLVDAFRAYRAPFLTPYPGVVDLLAKLRPRVRLGLVTDGDVGVQRSKVAALGLEECFDAVVFSDAIGRQFRKPHPAPFESALAALGASGSATVFVGDHPVKDVAGPTVLGLRAIRVLTGEYAHLQTAQPPWATVPTLAAAGDLLLAEFAVHS